MSKTKTKTMLNLEKKIMVALGTKSHGSKSHGLNMSWLEISWLEISWLEISWLEIFVPFLKNLRLKQA